MEQRDKEAWRQWTTGTPQVLKFMELADQVCEKAFMERLIISQMMRQAFSAGFDAGRGDGKCSAKGER